MLQVTLCCIYTFLFVFIIAKSSFFALPGISKGQIIGLFILKILVGIFLWEWFESHYPLTDSVFYFNDSKILADLLFESPSRFFHLFFGIQGQPITSEPILAHLVLWTDDFNTLLVNDTRAFIRLNTLFQLFSFGQFHVHTVFVCFISFVGLVYLYKLFYPYVSAVSYLLIVALFLFPTVLFWSSIVLKESVLFLGLGLLLYHTECGLTKKYGLKNGIGLIAGLVILVGIKVYVLIAIFPALITNSWIARTNGKWVLTKYCVTCFCLFIFALNIHFIFPAANPITIIKSKQSAFLNVAKGGLLLSNDSGRCIYLDYKAGWEQLCHITDTTFKLKKNEVYASIIRGSQQDSLLINGLMDTTTYTLRDTVAPAGSRVDIQRLDVNENRFAQKSVRAFYSVLMLSGLQKLKKPFAILLFAENAILLVLLIGLVCFFRRKVVPVPLILFCFSFVFILFCLIGLTTPILGALVRFRVPAIPFLIIGIALMVDGQKCKRFISRFKSGN